MSKRYSTQTSLKNTCGVLARLPLLLALAFITTLPRLHAEGVAQVAPNATDMVMLLIGSNDYGNFGQYNGPEASRLYVSFADADEVLYLGLSRDYSPGGEPETTGSYTFRIRRVSDGAVVHGPYNVGNLTENLTNWADAAAGPAALNGGVGYATDDPRFTFSPDEAGLYYIEFLGASRIGFWDFTVAQAGQAVPGRVYSKNWAFRTPSEGNFPPDCVWARQFNGQLYSYTSDGFVSRIDFANSGFQGLSFTVAFNRQGPGDTGNPALDRMSIPNANVSDMAAEHLIFLQEPDPALFPDGACGEVTVAEYFECVSGQGYCLDVSVTRPGQVEIILDFNANGTHDPGLDRRLVHIFNPGDALNHCVTWDGLLGDGNPPAPGATVDLIVQFTQGVQHWALYDAEKLADGFCVDLIRPICDPEAMTDILYWDDRMILEEPGTSAPKDGRGGCECATEACRTWMNFSPNNDDCSVINDNITTGYGDKSTLNTWWFASSIQETFTGIPLVDMEILGEEEICQGFSTEYAIRWLSSAEIVEITWTGPNGLIASGPDAPTIIEVSEAGWYEATIVDDNGCEFTAAKQLTLDNCPADLELDITADDLTPDQGQAVQFTITLTNMGPGLASGVSIAGMLPPGLINVVNISAGGSLQGDEITWEDLAMDVGQVLTFTFTATVAPAFDYTVLAEVTAADQADTDSTPNNGVDTDNDGQCADDLGDEDDGDCVELAPPACGLEVTVGAITCLPNGTLSDPSDDSFTVELSVSGSQGAQGWVANDPSSASGAYGSTLVLGPFPIAAGDLHFTVSDAFFGEACSAEVVVAAPATCSDLCVLELEVGDVLCHDGGTPTVGDDDTFTVAVRLTGANTGAGWEMADGQMGSYGEWVTIGPFLIASGPVELVFADEADAGCAISETVTPPLSCSNDCDIVVAVGEVTCLPNGTLSDPSDDLFTVELTVTGANTSDGWLATDALNSTGGYDETIILGPYPIAGGDLNFTVQDAAQGEACAVPVQVSAPATCSDLCVISLEVDHILCMNNGTPSVAEDDLWTFDLRVSGLNTGAGWISGTGHAGPYDTWLTIGPLSIAEGALLLNITDAEDPGCMASTSVEPPATCSNECEITSTVIGDMTCDNQGTPTDPSDDTFTFTVTVNGNNLSGSWTATDGAMGEYGVPTLFGPYPVSMEDVQLWFHDSEDDGCVSAAVVQAPEHCSNECLISAAASNVVCLDNSTPYDPSDDQFQFDMVVEALNSPGPAWTMAGGTAGFYGETYAMGPYDIADGDVTLTIRDILDAECVSILEVAATPTCSQSCEIQATVLNAYCQDQSTELQTTDDGYVYEIVVEGINVSGTWTASDGTTGNFGEPTLSVSHPYGFEPSSVTITADEGDCAITVDLFAPRPSLLCPEDTDQQSLGAGLQKIKGSLQAGDQQFSNTPCWMTSLNSTPMTIGDRYFDIIIFDGPDDDGDTTTTSDQAAYAFYLFSSINLPEEDFPGEVRDGTGALFKGAFDELDDPCDFVMNYRDQLPTAAEPLLVANPALDTTGFFDQEMYLVQRFTQYLKFANTYSLVTTSYLPENVGDYVWVIVALTEEPLALADNTIETDFSEQTVSYDLTHLDIDWVMENPESFEMLGYPGLEPGCGVDSIGHRDELVFDTNCEDGFMTRTFLAFGNGGEVLDSCAQTITFRRPTYQDILLPPATAQFNCGADYLTTALGYPHPVESGYPVLTSGLIDSILVEGLHHNFSVSYKDQPVEDTTTAFTSIIREWTIVDICSGDSLLVYPQQLLIGNFAPPTLVCPLSNHYCPILEDDIMLFGTDPLICTATLEAPWPGLIGDCTDGEAWDIFTEVLLPIGPDTLILDSIGWDEDRVVAGLELGDYLFRYTAYNAEGDMISTLCRFRVADLQEPTAVCNGDMSVSLNGYGRYRLYPQQIDHASYDNCGDITFEVRRPYFRDPGTCDTLLTTVYSDWGPYVEFNCCDAGLYIPVEMRITDESGLQNMCWLYVYVRDNTLPECTGLVDLQLSCADLPFDFDPLDTLQLQAVFGYPQVIDNCAAYAYELAPVVDWGPCQSGAIVRRFLARDRFGNVSSTVFEQHISISYDNGYGIRFPEDVDTDCLEALPDLAFLYPGCADLEITVEDEFLPVEGEECYFLERTYHVINHCEYDGLSDPLVVRRDEDCDGTEGEAPVWVLVDDGFAWIDADSLPGNDFPAAGVKGTACDGDTNPEGYWRDLNSVGYWTYTQRIRLFDVAPPVIAYLAPEPFCTTDEACEAEVTVDFSVEEFCLPEEVTITVELDANDDGAIDADLTNSGVLTGEWPNYQLQGAFPLGEHAFVLTATDGCGNEAEVRINFSVVDCYVPDPIAYSGLIVDLAAVPSGTDADGDGDLDEGAVTVFAADLASCEQTDCSSPLVFSVNRIGEQPDMSRSSIVLTCDDRYHVDLEVHVWDQAGNPYAEQPDGSLGGPNRKAVLVEVYVQDPEQVCTYCGDDDLFIEGLVRTAQNEPVAGVALNLQMNGSDFEEKTTLDDGLYHFAGLESGADYHIRPSKTGDGITNGLTALDVALLQAHIVNNLPITDPYTLAAADANASGTITSLDLLLIQAVLLGNADAFPNNSSWRFVPADHPFATYSPDFPGGLAFEDLAACQMGQDFVAIKIGDLNSSAYVGGESDLWAPGSRAKWSVYLPEQNLRAGMLYRIPVRLADVDRVRGLQMGWYLDPNLLKVEEIEPGLLSAADMNTSRLSAGTLLTAWARGAATPAHDLLFTLVVRATGEGELAKAIELRDELMTAEVYGDDFTIFGAQLGYLAATAQPIVLGNRPDPFTTTTTIDFFLPEAGEATLEVRDIQGRQLFMRSAHYAEGTHQFELATEDWPAGVLYYSLQINGQRITRRMIKI